MGLIKLNEICQLAEKGKFAVPAMACFNYESIKWAVEAAEEENSPIILMLYPDEEDIIPLECFTGICRMVAQMASVPVAVHLDHCEEFEHVILAASRGCTGVMIDASSKSFEDNVRLTSEVVKSAHAMGVPVEAELGHVGFGDNEGDYINTDQYTNVEDAKRFVELTNVDALAVAIGTAHGAYKKAPQLDLGRLAQINKAIETPLVLHGGSGTPDTQIQEAVRLGINKVNICTEYYALFFNELKKVTSSGEISYPNQYEAMMAIKPALVDFVKAKINLLRP